jgi:hypothetical protein
LRLFRSGSVLVLALAALSACGGEEAVITEPAAEPVTVTETVEVGATTEEAETEEATTEEAPPEPDAAGVGDALSLAGYESGYRVKLVRVKDNPPHDQYLGPERGQRFYSAYIRVTVTDGSPTEVCAGNDATVVDSRDQTHTTYIDIAEPPFGCPRIAVGETRAGWVTFQVPKKAKLVKFVYTPDSGFADQSGEWEL